MSAVVLIRLASGHGQIQIMPAMTQPTWLLALTVTAIILALALAGAAILLPKFRRQQEEHPIKASSDSLNAWRQRIDQVVAQYDKGHLNRDQAMTALAAIARGFASRSWNSDMKSKTLAEIQAQPRTPSTRQGLDLLRQTIDALYPPEFALSKDSEGTDTTVNQAADWVRELIERWPQ
ncbi:hypothetical protein [Bifidobacterium asteroides]|uniref:Uncharacterized protein n=1 Tax=Bifidobacterium asteroides TaxID=1684 RepID=A0A2N3RAI9_9BIFI|nr:hypothetical protein [Bifidobacterium asteroides]PKV09513.1 hypothetical protein CQR44_1048 [Bifidobacterium asteroides]